MTPEWAASKAQAVTDAWRARYGSTPSKASVMRVLWVALHETRCGDAWPGEHNWGAVQRRALTKPERELATRAMALGVEAEARALLAGRTAAEAKAERARVQREAGPQPTNAGEALHWDSSPTSGRYPCWFAAFPSDVEGAGHLLKTLLDNRPAIKARAATLTAWELAELMYRSRYYEGFHDPRPTPGEVVAKGGLTKGQTANVSDYASALRRAERAFDVALERWTPEGGLEPEPWPPRPVDLLEVRALQAALRALGYDVGPLDGVRGPRTKAAVRAYQATAGLKPDGVDGPKTRGALARDVAPLARPEGY
jgi:murein L,D-transpeptidase YcbB/YkuD